MNNWHERFKNKEDELIKQFHTSLPINKRLYKEDIASSLAHVTMLVYSDLITPDEGEKLVDGLESILTEIESGSLKVEGDYNDIHSFVELTLIERIGETGNKLQIGRSQYDQVAVSMRLFARNKAIAVGDLVEGLINSLREKAEANNVKIPGHAQSSITLEQHLGAYIQMFTRDRKRIANTIELMDENPLGCGKLEETIYEIDRGVTTSLLGFSKPVDNFLDGMSDRDYIVELLSDFSIMMMHVSRLCEDLILWNNESLNFIQFDDAFVTDSSFISNKKNPETAELIQGKTGRVYSSLFAMLTTLKSLPLTYNKDMQEDQEQFFDAVDTVMNCILVMTEMIDTLKVKSE